MAFPEIQVAQTAECLMHIWGLWEKVTSQLKNQNCIHLTEFKKTIGYLEIIFKNIEFH